jgi:type II secretory pathway pseudopilin PulG
VLATRTETLRRVGTLLAVIGLLGVALTLAFPPTTTVTDVTDRATVETQTGTSATVEGDYELYEAGETLSDEPVYIRDVTPTVTVTASTRAPPVGVDIDQELALVYEVTTVDGTVFRQQRRVLATSSGTVDSEDDVVETSATLDSEAVAATLAAMHEEIGDAGEVTAYVAVETDYAAPDYEGSIADREPLTVSADSFAVPGITAAAEHHTTETATRPIPDRVFQPTLPGIGTVVIPHTTPALVIVALLGATALIAVRRSRGTIDADRTRVQLHRQRYDEWISRGTLPETLGEWSTDISVDSLEALVDVAIDSETRVIYDPSVDRYAVVTAGATYVFTPTGPS